MWTLGIAFLPLVSEVVQCGKVGRSGNHLKDRKMSEYKKFCYWVDFQGLKNVKEGIDQISKQVEEKEIRFKPPKGSASPHQPFSIACKNMELKLGINLLLPCQPH